MPPFSIATLIFFGRASLSGSSACYLIELDHKNKEVSSLTANYVHDGSSRLSQSFFQPKLLDEINGK